MSPVSSTGALVIGGGPAGLAPLLAASRSGLLDRLLEGGLTVAERDARVGGGRLGRYLIRSDSLAETFLSCVADHPDPGLAALLHHPSARAIAGHARDAVPLELVAAFLEAVGGVLAGRIASAPAGRVLTRHEAVSVRRTRGGGWSTRLSCSRTGTETEIRSRAVLMALGGFQPDPHLAQVAGRSLVEGCGSRLVPSDPVLTAIGQAEISRRLAKVARPRIVVVGGSTSALSCVRALLDSLGDALGPGALTLMYRRPLRIWYPSAAAAVADGYDRFGPDDICALSGMVHRFGGLRLDSRALAMGALGIGNIQADPRLRLHRLAVPDMADPDRPGAACEGVQDPAGSARLLDEADLVVSALGYRPRRIPVLDVDGRAIALDAEQPDGRLVGPGAGILAADGRELPGLFGIGLAAGFRPDRSLGGELSFAGQVNGLWLWQTAVGDRLATRLVEAVEARPQRFRRAVMVPQARPVVMPGAVARIRAGLHP